jgi:hypothetical protein
MATQHVYRGYTLNIVAQGVGWQIFVHAPDTGLAIQDMPTTREPGGMAQVLAEARRLVDGALDQPKAPQK